MRGLLLVLLLWFVADANAAGTAPLVPTLLDAQAAPPALDDLAAGRFDTQFGKFVYRDARRRGGPFWLKLDLPVAARGNAPALVVSKGDHLQVSAYAVVQGRPQRLVQAATLHGFRGVHDALFPVPADAGPSLYVQVTDDGSSGAEELRFAAAPLADVLSRHGKRTLMISAAFGALLAMSLASLLIFPILPDRIFLLYGGLFLLQAIYVAFISGQGFGWPLLEGARALEAHAWNLPAAFSGAIACLFVREIADLKRVMPRMHALYGVLAAVFVALAFANVADRFGYGALVAQVGNLIFVGSAALTLIVLAIAWRRGSRAAGWFLVAWALLETFTILTAVSFLFGEEAPMLVFYGLPLSMVTAAVLVALGVADRLREQRRALSDAERRAQTDPLTGVLNRRSLIERLEAACARARARGLPVSLLFIDLDHFKDINDRHGHLAGDACLRAVVAPIAAELRQSDVIGRYGGEEFVVILSSADSRAAQAIAHRIVQQVAALAVDGFGAPIRLTCSIGVASSDADGVWGEALIARADAAVYSAKNEGRNRVRLAAA